MSKLRDCRGCGCVDSGTKVFRCEQCKRIFCTNCSVMPGLSFSHHCPTCETDYKSTLGEVE